MQSTGYIYFMLFIIVFFIYLPMKRRRKEVTDGGVVLENKNGVQII